MGLANTNIRELMLDGGDRHTCTILQHAQSLTIPACIQPVVRNRWACSASNKSSGCWYVTCDPRLKGAVHSRKRDYYSIDSIFGNILKTANR